ncbi:glycosyltransferase family 61 protein [Natrinema sp. 74]|uniref:glycosyltransferase family 61 protein n=1 Tax=Natrinema sp. 74 TaxID=3384159 RepID=UPI0038D44303
MNGVSTVSSKICKFGRTVYADHVRSYLASLLFERGTISTLTRESLASETNPHVVRTVTVGEAETVEPYEPPCVGTLPDGIREKIRPFELSAPFVAELENVQLIGPDALPILPDGSVVLEGVEGSFDRAMDACIRCLAAEKIPIRRSTTSEYELAVSLAGPWSDEFFHWFVEYLPRIISIERYSEQFEVEPVYFIPADAPKWLLRSLELFGVSDDDLVPWSSGRVDVQRLLLPSLLRQTETTASSAGYVNSPSGVHQVSKRLRGSVSQTHKRTDVGSHLYVSREGAHARKIVNEDKLHPFLDAYAFDVVHPEEWSLDEQIATFANATVIAGPHGGGLTNAMYASDPTILELFGSNDNPCYFALFAGSGLEYGLVKGDSVGPNIYIDPSDFEQLCDRLIR